MPTIILFYLMPFIIVNLIKIKKLINYSILLFSAITVIISIKFFDYNLYYTGGGIILHLSQFIFKNNYIFFIISFISIYLILLLFSNKIENLIIITLLFLGNPQITIYHKYYDPMILILLFLMFNIEIKLKNFYLNKKIIFIYFYFLSFLLVNIAK